MSREREIVKGIVAKLVSTLAMLIVVCEGTGVMPSDEKYVDEAREVLKEVEDWGKENTE